MGDILVFGKETKGLPQEILSLYSDRAVAIPMANPNIRSLNLAMAAGIVLFEALRQQCWTQASRTSLTDSAISRMVTGFISSFRIPYFLIMASDSDSLKPVQRMIGISRRIATSSRGELGPFHFRHSLIGYHQVIGFRRLAEEFQGLVAGADRFNPVAEAGEQFLHHPDQGCFVINQQNVLRPGGNFLCLPLLDQHALAECAAGYRSKVVPLPGALLTVMYPL